MSYTKQTWANGDIITAAKLNHMEDGIAGVEADVSSLDTQLLASMPHDTASGSIASFPDGAAMPVRDLSVDIEPVQSGSGDPSPDNIRPISGWTGAEVEQTGVNVWDEEWEVGSIDDNTGANVVGTTIRAKNHVHVKPNTSYYFYVGNNVAMRLFFYGKDKEFLSFINTGSVSFTTPSNAYYIRFRAYNAYGTTYNNDISINYPSTDHDYHAYQGQTYTIDLDGTRYGGTLDVTTGKLTVTNAIVDMGTLSYTYQSLSGGRNAFYAAISGIVPHVSNDIAISAISSMYKAVSWSDSWTNGVMSYSRDVNGSGNKKEVTFINNAYTDANTFKSAMSGQTIVYPLATPVEVTLSPTEITTLLGTNNIFADCGDTTVDYYADTTLFVNKKIAAAVAALS